jgi:hypothetical protein
MMRTLCLELDVTVPLLVLTPDPSVAEGAARADKSRRTRGSGDEEWYTPEDLLNAVKAVLGVIDLDPASCPLAQRNIQARTYYTKAQDGLRQDWHGKVFLNPPYHVPVIAWWCHKLLEELAARRTTEAILLVKSITHIPWFQTVARHAQAICFPERKRRFGHPTKDGKDPVVGSALLYFGPHVQRFCEVFASEGLVTTPVATIPAPGSQLTFADAQEIRPWRSPPTAA